VQKKRLPISYTNIRPNKPGKAEPSVCEKPEVENFPSISSATSEAGEWIQVLEIQADLIDKRV